MYDYDEDDDVDCPDCGYWARPAGNGDWECSDCTFKFNPADYEDEPRVGFLGAGHLARNARGED